MFKDFLIRKMLKAQLKDVPEAQQEQLIAVVQKNPELFQQLAAEIQEKVKSGMPQMAAAMEVVKAHQAELSTLTAAPAK
jgi:hypothetical protein